MIRTQPVLVDTRPFRNQLVLLRTSGSVKVSRGHPMKQMINLCPDYLHPHSCTSLGDWMQKKVYYERCR